MTEFYQHEDILVYNKPALSKLIRSITNSQGYFTLILVHCNYQSLREMLVQQLRAECQIEIRELHLLGSTKTLYTTIETNLIDVETNRINNLPQALMIFGLELVESIDHLLVSTNQVREEFRKNFQFPIVLFVNNEVFQKLIRFAPDFKNWAGNPIAFKISTYTLLENLCQTVSCVSNAIVDVSAGQFLDNTSLNLELATLNLSEIEFAFKDLQSVNQELELELEANVKFLLGREADIKADTKEDKLTAKNYYEQSLAIWQQKFKDKKNISSNDVKSYGCLLCHLGLWWRQFATLHRKQYKESCLKAKEYLQICVEIFEQYNHPNLAVNFINKWGEVLTRLEEWGELEKLLLSAIELHQNYSEPIKLAYSYGLMAEVLMQKKQWLEAKQYAELALKINGESASTTNTPLGHTINWEWEKLYCHNLYLILIAEAQQNLNQLTEAAINLRNALLNSNSERNPLLNIRILKNLHFIDFEQGEYLKAFEEKLKQRSIEQQYGLRAFVGAGRLEFRRQVINPLLAKTPPKSAVSQEIMASGRMQDVSRLVKRISRHDYRLTVIYGQSGVGKSSLVQAGLIPALKEEAIAARDVVPVLLQNYTDWTNKIKDIFKKSLEEVKGLSQSLLLNTMASFIEELHKNENKNLLTVLIFDQFEEFFFAYKDHTERELFFDFMSECLNVSYVKVILSLREDYLHYLLEFNRYLSKSDCLKTLDVINNNILDKDILYYLGNFSPKDAHSVIQGITENSQLHLEPNLIDRLVQDLAGTLNEVRPIELQIIGSQLETEEITTLFKYQEYGPKEKLVERFLEDVVKDCGPNNKQSAELVLYLLTDENNTRPLKTQSELEESLSLEPKILDLILQVLVKSGLVFQIPGFPNYRYQLVHDYLVSFIREKQSETLIKQLEKEKEQRKLAEVELYQVLKQNLATESEFNQVLKQKLKISRRYTFTLLGLIASISITLASMLIITINMADNNKNLVKNDITNFLNGFPDKYPTVDSLFYAIKAIKKMKEKENLSLISHNIKLQSLKKITMVIKKFSEITRREDDDKIKAFNFSRDNKMLATASESKNNHTVKIWHIPHLNIPPIILTGHTDSITSVSFNPNPKKQIIATASKDGTVIIWDISDGKQGRQIQILKDNMKSVIFLKFSSKGQLLATISEDGKIRIWDLKGKLVWVSQFPANHNKKNGIKDEVLSFNEDDSMIVTYGKDNTLKIWNFNRKKTQSYPNDYYDNNIKFPDFQYNSNFPSAILSPDHNLWASYEENVLILWNNNQENSVQNDKDLDYLLNKACDLVLVILKRILIFDLMIRIFVTNKLFKKGYGNLDIFKHILS